jgi:predicted  nucleic acid-binding Zn-ribbon protein
MIDADINNIEALAASLTSAADAFLKALKKLEREALDLEARVQSKRDEAAREGERLDAALAQKRQAHEHLAASVRVFEDKRAAILKRIDAGVKETSHVS